MIPEIFKIEQKLIEKCPKKYICLFFLVIKMSKYVWYVIFRYLINEKFNWHPGSPLGRWSCQRRPLTVSTADKLIAIFYENYVMRESQIGTCVHVILNLPSEARPPRPLTCFFRLKSKSSLEYHSTVNAPHGVPNEGLSLL